MIKKDRDLNELIKNSFRKTSDCLIFVDDNGIKETDIENKQEVIEMIKNNDLYLNYKNEIIQSINKDSLFRLSDIFYEMNKEGYYGTMIPFEKFEFYDKLVYMLLKVHESRLYLSLGSKKINLINYFDNK